MTKDSNGLLGTGKSSARHPKAFIRQCINGSQSTWSRFVSLRQLQYARREQLTLSFLTML